MQSQAEVLGVGGNVELACQVELTVGQSIALAVGLYESMVTPLGSTALIFFWRTEKSFNLVAEPPLLTWTRPRKLHVSLLLVLLG